MMIGCQRRLDFALAHYGKGEAVGQGPGFIWSFAEYGTALLKEVMAGGDDFHVGLTLQRREQRYEFLPGPWRGKSVTDFGQHPFRRDKRTGRLPAQFPGLRVKLVAGVDQGEEVNRVTEDGLHRFGTPRR